MKLMRHEIHESLARHGCCGNLFINTSSMDPGSEGYGTETATWEELDELVEFGWQVGAHTVTDPNLSELAAENPQGEKLQWVLDICDVAIKQHLETKPRNFAFTSINCSSVTELKVKQRCRFGHLWVVGTHCHADGEAIRHADLVSIEGEDEADRGPPHAVRYISRDSNHYRLPSPEIQRSLIYSLAVLRTSLVGPLAN